MDIIANTVQDYLVTIASGIEHKKLIAGVRMYFGQNKTPIDTLLQTVCLYTVCGDHCLSNNICTPQTKKLCPKFTQQTMYIIRWISQQPQMGARVYPNLKTWQDEPQWFINAFSIASQELNRINKSKMENK